MFYDVDSIPAGERWRDVLVQAIDNASHFYLLWCTHSAGSQEVQSEYERAISANKRLVPVLLDSTPLIKPLTDYQWVDFRGVVEGHEAADPPAPRARWPFAIGALTIILVVTALLVSLLASDPSAAPSTQPGALFALLVVVAVLALLALIARSYQGSREARRAAEQVAEAIAQDLATR